MGWVNNKVRWSINCLRLWNRLLTKSPDSLLYKTFCFDFKNCVRNNRVNWSHNIKVILESINKGYDFINMNSVNINQVTELLCNNQSETWKNDIKLKPKLRSYIEFKENYCTEKYIMYNLDRYERSLMSQLRLGILPLRIETGRFKNEPVNERICMMCNNNNVESEYHFLFHCTAYNDQRQIFYNKLLNINKNSLINMEDKNKMKILCNDNVRKFAKYLKLIYNVRQNTIYDKT